MSYMRKPHYVYCNGDEVVFDSLHINVDDFDAIALMRVVKLFTEESERIDAAMDVIEANYGNIGTWKIREMFGENPSLELTNWLLEVQAKRKADD